MARAPPDRHCSPASGGSRQHVRKRQLHHLPSPPHVTLLPDRQRGQKPRARQPCKRRRAPHAAGRGALRAGGSKARPAAPRRSGHAPRLALPCRGGSLETSPKSLRSQAAGAPSPPPPAPAFNCSGCWEISRLNLSNSNFQPGDRVLPLSARLEAPKPLPPHRQCRVPLHLLPQPGTVLPPPPTHRFIFSHYRHDPCALRTVAGPRASQQQNHGGTGRDRDRGIRTRCRQPGLTCVCGRPRDFYERSGSQSYLYWGGQRRAEGGGDL